VGAGESRLLFCSLTRRAVGFAYAVFTEEGRTTIFGFLDRPGT